MGILAFFGFILVIIVIVACTSIISYEGDTAISITLLVVGVIGLLFIIAYISNTPTALDVYEGKTELRTTYEGKVPVDSVVIYKK